MWESLPVGAEADEHALIVTAAGTYTPSGRELTGPVDSVEKLDKLVRWASLGADREFPDQRRPRHRLRQLAAHPVVAVAQRRTAALLPVRGVPARGGN
ncbi:hypothetical protein AZG88_13280 [Rhodococcus sp. LB1]|nr:hypothetical protein AZG88_13280 [Rhodococcus sp. LB1]